MSNVEQLAKAEPVKQPPIRIVLELCIQPGVFLSLIVFKDNDGSVNGANMTLNTPDHSYGLALPQKETHALLKKMQAFLDLC